jgi:hypothetical protein
MNAHASRQPTKQPRVVVTEGTIPPDPDDDIPFARHRVTASIGTRLDVTIERGEMSDGSPDQHWLEIDWPDDDVTAPDEIVALHELLGVAIVEARARGILPPERCVMTAPARSNDTARCENLLRSRGVRASMHYLGDHDAHAAVEIRRTIDPEPTEVEGKIVTVEIELFDRGRVPDIVELKGVEGHAMARIELTPGALAALHDALTLAMADARREGILADEVAP